MSAHTPKPWIVEKGGCIRSAAPEAGRQYARGIGYPQVALVTGLHEDRPEGEREANERLICAAPDLLEAANDAISACRVEWCGEGVLPDGNIYCVTCGILRAAIAKAVPK